MPVLDRGFVFGDGVYEMIPAFAGKAFRLRRHLHRLNDSLLATRIENPYSTVAWQQILESLLQKNEPGNSALYVQVTRGVAPRDHVTDVPMCPSVLIMATSLTPRSGIPEVSAITCQDNRWDRCDIKSVSLLPNILLRLQADDQQAYEALLIRDGVLTEGAASNVFIVSDGTIKTPPKSTRILPGITRDVLLELMVENNIRHQQCEIEEAELLHADEIWLSSSTRELVAVTLLNGVPVGTGGAGEFCKKLDGLYQQYKQGNHE